MRVALVLGRVVVVVALLPVEANAQGEVAAPPGDAPAPAAPAPPPGDEGTADGEAAVPPPPQPQQNPPSPPQSAPPPYPPPGYAPPYPPPPYGYPPPPYGYPPPQHGYYYVPRPYPRPPTPQGQYLHNGFYLRMGLGVGYGVVTSEGTIDGGRVDAKYTGVGPVYELLIGGTLGKGWVLGGGFVGQDIIDPDLSVEGSTELDTEADGWLGVGAIGPFVDWFPDPSGGFHAGAMIGLGILGLVAVDGDVSDREPGIAGSLWAGYDFWVGPQWSLGFEGRAILANGTHTASSSFGSIIGLRDEEFDDRGSTFQLLFTALYH